MEIFLNYLYSDELCEDEASTMLLQIATKFNVSRLANVCSELLCNSLNEENSIGIFIAAAEVRDRELVSRLFQNYDKEFSLNKYFI